MTKFKRTYIIDEFISNKFECLRDDLENEGNERTGSITIPAYQREELVNVILAEQIKFTIALEKASKETLGANYESLIKIVPIMNIKDSGAYESLLDLVHRANITRLDVDKWIADSEKFLIKALDTKVSEIIGELNLEGSNYLYKFFDNRDDVEEEDNSDN